MIPGKVVFTVDIRSPEQGKLDLMRGEVERAAPAVAAELGLGIAIEPVGHFDPVTFDPGLVKTVRAAAERLGYAHMDIVERRRARRLLDQPGGADGDDHVPLRGRAVATTRPRRSRPSGRRRGRMCCSTRCWRRRRCVGPAPGGSAPRTPEDIFAKMKARSQGDVA